MEPRVLIVDDEESLVQVLCRTLEAGFPGVQVDVAYSGEEGLSRLAEMAYDLIIADLRMPGFDGLDLIRGVRYLNPDVPIILATGYGTAEARRQADRLRVDRFLDKPFNVAEMIAVARDLLTNRDVRE